MVGARVQGMIKKKIKRIIEEGRNNQTDRLRERAAIRQGPGK